MRTTKAKVIRTHYWRPGDNFLKAIATAIEGKVEEEDIVTISEKALSTAMGNIFDESTVKPGLAARFLAKYWMPIIWGYFLGPACRLKAKNLERIRNYPLEEGSTHKQVVLMHAGVMQALNWGSEGGIDATNLPFSYVSLPLEAPEKTANTIRDYINEELGMKVTVILVDTDKTYSLGGFHFTPRPHPIKGIHSRGGFLAYVLGRTLRLKRRSTPIAIAGSRIAVDVALDIAEATHRKRGSGAGRTVWDMAGEFGVPLTHVTWEMLKNVEHKPIVIFKRSSVSFMS